MCTRGFCSMRNRHPASVCHGGSSSRYTHGEPREFRTNVKASLMCVAMVSCEEDKRMWLKKEDRVRHPLKAEWGLGEVLEDSNGETVRVFFVGTGPKTLSLKYVTLECIPTGEAAHPVLDHLRVPEKRDRQPYQ